MSQGETKTARRPHEGPRANKALRYLRWLLPLAVLVVGGVGLALHAGFGTLSDFGWKEISILCPLGALSTMLASKMAVPRAIVSIGIVVVLIIAFGRFFCGWICPVPFVSKLRDAFSKKKEPEAAEGMSGRGADARAAAGEDAGASGEVGRATFDSRHFVLGGALLSAGIFGFPVFCLVCPIGLSFATVLLLIRAFGYGDVTVALVVVPVLLLVEVVFFRKWCGRICPLGAFMSLVGKLNRTFRPKVDAGTCLETAQGRKCGVCRQVCGEKVDLHHPHAAASGMNECTRCRKCIDSCPVGAIQIKLADFKLDDAEVEAAKAASAE